MSFNLYCEETNLWQTPTWVTEMCMSTANNGRPDGGWKGVLRRYKIWVNRPPSDDLTPEQREAWKEGAKAHLDHLDAIVKRKKKLTFYWI